MRLIAAEHFFPSPGHGLFQTGIFDPGCN